MSFRIIHPGTFSLLVDRGRPGSRSLGIPLSGAADRAAHAIGNALVGNSTEAIALEMSFSGPTLEAENEASACVFGAPFAVSIDNDPISPGCVFRCRKGALLKIGGTAQGARGYLCVFGGFLVESILGSGTALAPVTAGDRLVCAESSRPGRSLACADAASLLEESTANEALRAIDGPQADWFPFAAFYGRIYTVSAASNRMGVRLEGDPLARQPREMVSEAVAPGAVQITNEGLPIVLGVDGQTIGGYPKIAHVIRADLDRIAQLRPGQSVRFERVSLEEAEIAARERQRKLRRWLTASRLEG